MFRFILIVASIRKMPQISFPTYITVATELLGLKETIVMILFLCSMHCNECWCLSSLELWVQKNFWSPHQFNTKLHNFFFSWVLYIKSGQPRNCQIEWHTDQVDAPKIYCLFSESSKKSKVNILPNSPRLFYFFKTLDHQTHSSNHHQ